MGQRLVGSAVRREYVARARERLGWLFTEEARLKETTEAGFAFMWSDENDHHRLSLLMSSRMLVYKTFQALMCGGQSYQMTPVVELWDSLVSAGIFVKTWGPTPGQVCFGDHTIDVGLLLEHLQNGTFECIFYPPAYLHSRYSPSCVAVDVTREEDAARGSGFVVRDGRSRLWLLTCRHNVDPGEGVRDPVFTIAERPLAVGEARLSDAIDLAVFPLAVWPACVPFVLSDRGDVFEETYTLGYPQVPGSVSGLLGHRGEINARVEVYLERTPALIISNLVSPGSSGGPVLDRYGRCIGMTIRWLERDYGGQLARFSAAIPAATLIRELARLAG